MKPTIQAGLIKNLNLGGALLLLAVLGGCWLAAAPDTAAPGAHDYSARGVVEKIAPDRRQVTIRHQAIPGYMMGMTMDFPVADTNELQGVSPGDKITFTLVVTQTNDWVENIRLTGHTSQIMSSSMPGGRFTRLKPGDLLPDGDLLTEAGRHIHFSHFRGKAVAFTFFFTRCPLPNYCPLMNRNFDQARALLLAMPHAPTNWQFLSISFDPGYDTPQVLSNYAEVYRAGNPDRWLFADATTNTLAHLAAHLGLMVMRQGDNISHNLRTVVLDPQGRIFCQFNGNQWTPQQLADALVAAARGEAAPPKSQSSDE